ncbi:hypothetical protein F511_04110 [Dorcoceras hygrometricum]|nr:hypothetical protein F511_04110 [Dorcoceras hygrometricum]
MKSGFVTAGQNLYGQIEYVVLFGYLHAACLDWSRREDIQARTVKGRLSWTGRRYLAGTIHQPAGWRPAGWRPAGNGAKLEPRSSSKSRKEQNELSCRQKEAQMPKLLKDRVMMQSNQLEEETS